MLRRIILMVAMALVAAPANAKSYSLSFTPTATQATRYEQGTKLIDSVQPSTVVRVIEVEGRDKKSASFVIGVFNRGDHSFIFGPENIVVRPADGEAVHLITYEQAMEAERKKQKKEKFWSGVAAFGRGMSAANAGTTDGSGTYSGTYGSGFYNYSETNSAAQLAAQRDARAMNRQDRADLEAKAAARTSALGNLLRTTTVDPGKLYGGFAAFAIDGSLRDAREPQQVTVEVTIDGEKHSFTGRLSATD